MEKLEIRLLGEPEVLVDGRARPLPPSKKARALLGYLVTLGRPQRRERLCELLWQGPDDPRAGLRWSLAKLRPLLDVGGAVRIAADRERVGFESNGAHVDVLALRAVTDSALAATAAERLGDIATSFRGPFLEGLDLASCPLFHAWCVAEREAMRTQHVRVLTALVERLRNQPALALGHARALVTLDPLAESPRLAVLDLLSALGDRRQALEEYHDYARALDRELRIKPSFELERRRMALGHPSAPGATAGPILPQPSCGGPILQASQLGVGILPHAPPARRTLDASPLVGRHYERDLIEQTLDGVGRGVPVLLIFGEPGIGKTRLLEELAQRARARGGMVLTGRAFEAELVRPYGAFIEALRGGLGISFDEGGSRDLSALLSAAFAGAALDRTQLYEDVARLLGAACCTHPLLVLALDDLQWFDEASTELLHYIARALSGTPLVLAASARPGELQDNPASQRLVRALGRERLSRSIELGPLAPDDLRTLVRAVNPNVDVERVLLESAGNPLFALEAARALETGTQDLVGSLSTLIAERLGKLQEVERSLLSWAGALGRSFDVEVLANVTGLSASELVTSLEHLERHAILRVRDCVRISGHRGHRDQLIVDT